MTADALSRPAHLFRRHAYVFRRHVWVFARLYWRSYTLVMLAIISPALIGCYGMFRVTERHLGVDVWYWPHGAESVLLIVPLFSAYLVGSTIVEVYNGRFSWTLPGVRWDFLAATVFCGALAAVGTAWLYHLDGGTMSPGATGAVAAGGYGLMVRAQVSDGRDLSRSRLGLIVLWFLAVNTISSLGASYPFIVSLPALPAAAAALLFVFAGNNLRSLKYGPRRSMISGMTMYSNASHRRELAARARQDTREWAPSYLGTEIVGWVKAFEYETTGDSRLGPLQLGANFRPLLFGAAAVAVPVVFSIRGDVFEQATFAEGFTVWMQILYEWLLLVDFDTGDPQRPNIVWHVTNLLIAAYGFELAMPTSRERLADLRPKFLYRCRDSGWGRSASGLVCAPTSALWAPRSPCSTRRLWRVLWLFTGSLTRLRSQRPCSLWR